MNEGSLGLCTRLGSTFRLKQELVGEVPTEQPGTAEEIKGDERSLPGAYWCNRGQYHPLLQPQGCGKLPHRPQAGILGSKQPFCCPITQKPPAGTQQDPSFSSAPGTTPQDAPRRAFSQPTPGQDSEPRKEELKKSPQGWERHLQDGLNIPSRADILSLSARLLL